MKCVCLDHVDLWLVAVAFLEGSEFIWSDLSKAMTSPSPLTTFLPELPDENSKYLLIIKQCAPQPALS